VPKSTPAYRQAGAVAHRVKNFRLFEPVAGEFLKFPEDGSANRPGRFAGAPFFPLAFLERARKVTRVWGKAPKTVSNKE
jgi:hypothetical protein